MRHAVAGRKLGRRSEHRLALLRNLSTALFERERIVTTLAKAKELRPFAERLVTMSRKETLHARRLVMRHIHDRKVVAKMFDLFSARYAERPGGYTRIVKLGPRRGDNAEMALIEMVDAQPVETDAEPEADEGGSKKGKKQAGKPAEAREADAAEGDAPAEEAAEAKPARKKRARKKKADDEPAAED